MNDDHRKIIISRIIDDKQTESPQNGSAPGSPFQRWLFYLALIPIFIGILFMGMFFFSIFLALFVIVAAGIGIRFWWLRRKLQKSGRFDGEEKYVEIEDAEIIETKTNKPGGK
ncbi:PepSY domain-containing protein [Nitrosomonas sp. Nm132]|jgi:hypothetical protein|uniref:PepSY domain-containing protein n=1 Tax=Nitrosomonas sp. Nm132 TaxID=1881053 RepID=UPI00088C0F13|nr:PepSY domain-containing protein [Nitrosomonas sp. Nm132]SDH41444.1 hypothetical protein SAMN05428952_101325 [Nitrosomonas sp. Nm132]